MVQMQIFNQINARKIKDEYNPFSGLGRGAAFVYITLIEVTLQVRTICCMRMTLLGTVIVCMSTLVWQYSTACTCSWYFGHLIVTLFPLVVIVSVHAYTSNVRN